ncbi:MAG TPA: hypothetical protein VF266_19440, partial [Thermoanaerobaculia bacterium]
DLFPWWHRGAGPHYWLGRALVQMWSEVRWRAPFTEEQAETMREVHAALATAYGAEQRLTYPWRAWSELARWLALDDELAQTIHANAAASAETPLIGYRRHDVIATITEEWSVRVPGAFAQEWDENTWVAWEPGRSVRVSTLATQPQPDTITHAGGHWTLQCTVPGGEDSAALLTITFDDESHRDWAIATRDSLRWTVRPERQTHVTE